MTTKPRLRSVEKQGEVPTALTLESLTELVLASIKQMTEDEKRLLRETLRWDFYDRKLRPDVVN